MVESTSWFFFLVVCSFLVQCTTVETVQNRGEEAAGRHCRRVSCVPAHFSPSTVSCFWGSRSSFTQIAWVLLRWRLNLPSWCLIGRELLCKGESPTPVIQIFWSLYCHNRLPHRHFLEAAEPATLYSYGNLPFAVWGWWGPRLSYVTEFFPSAVFWNVMKSWHALQITYFYTHLSITKKKKIELCLGHSLVTLNFPVSLESEGAAVSVVSLPHCSSVSFSHVSLIEAVEVSGRMLTLRAPAGQHRAEQWDITSHFLRCLLPKDQEINLIRLQRKGNSYTLLVGK